MKMMIIIRGLSGSGKSTIADLICGNSKDRVAVSADDYFINEFTGEYEFDYSKLEQAHLWCVDEVGSLAKENVSTICVHNTFTKRWEIDPYLQIAYDFGYNIQIVSLFDCGENDYSLAKRCIHDVPIKAIKNQRFRYQHDVWKEHDLESENRFSKKKQN